MLAERTVSVLDAIESRILLLCDKAQSVSSIATQVADASLDDITKILDRFCEQGVMWFDGAQYLSLAVSFTTFLQSRATVKVEEAIDNLLSRRDCTSALS